MTPQELGLIKDNPNLSTASIARFTGLSWYAVDKVRNKPKWTHSGLGIPFISHSIGNRGLGYKVRFKNKTMASCSSFSSAMENLDRLIYCLENNDGKLPMTSKESIYRDLEFIKR